VVVRLSILRVSCCTVDQVSMGVLHTRAEPPVSDRKRFPAWTMLAAAGIQKFMTTLFFFYFFFDRLLCGIAICNVYGVFRRDQTSKNCHGR
jgi:hypothetical protein